MALIWTAIVVISVISGIMTGRTNEVSAAALEGVSAAVQLCISLAGILCLWTGVLEVMTQSGLTEKLSKRLHPLLSALFPASAGRPEVMQAISANVSANLLGLGNAATPYGVKAAGLLSRLSGGVASNDLCMLVVINTASLQLIPATVAGLRGAAGASAPFDILPAVWITSAASVTVGVCCTKILEKKGKAKS